MLGKRACDRASARTDARAERLTLENFVQHTSYSVYFGVEVRVICRSGRSDAWQHVPTLALQSPRCCLTINYTAAGLEIIKALCDGDNQQAMHMQRAITESMPEKLPCVVCRPRRRSHVAATRDRRTTARRPPSSRTRARRSSTTPNAHGPRSARTPSWSCCARRDAPFGIVRVCRQNLLNWLHGLPAACALGAESRENILDGCVPAGPQQLQGGSQR